MQKLQELRSWSLTFLVDIIIDIAAGILFGLGALAETGNITISAIFAIVIASSRSALKYALERSARKLETLKSENT